MNRRIGRGIITPIKTFTRWFVHFRLWILLIVGIAITLSELKEHLVDLSEPGRVNLWEILVYFLLLLIIGVLLESLVRVADRKTHAYHILDLKHELSHQLSDVSDWQEITTILHDFLHPLAPNTIVDLLTLNQEL